MNAEKQEDHFVPIVIDDKPYKAPKEKMTGAELRQLARPPIGADHDLFEVVPGPDDDVKIADQQVVDLNPGMHFYSVERKINPGDTPRLPEADEKYLKEKGLKYSMPTAGHLVLERVAVSTVQYDRRPDDAWVDVMIVIPPGYPLAKLDMFYVLPELKLKSGAYPQAAANFEEHIGRKWQRFSRHLERWRPGVDSLKSFLAFVMGELHRDG